MCCLLHTIWDELLCQVTLYHKISIFYGYKSYANNKDFILFFISTYWVVTYFHLSGQLGKEIQFILFLSEIFPRLNVKGNETGMFNSTQHFLTRMK